MGNVWSLRLLGYFSRPLSGLLISFPYPQFCSGIFGIFTNLLLRQPVSVRPVIRLYGFGASPPYFLFSTLFSELCVTFVFGLTCFYFYLSLTPTPSVLEQVISCSKVFRLFKGFARI